MRPWFWAPFCPFIMPLQCWKINAQGKRKKRKRKAKNVHCFLFFCSPPALNMATWTLGTDLQLLCQSSHRTSETQIMDMRYRLRRRRTKLHGWSPCNGMQFLTELCCMDCTVHPADQKITLLFQYFHCKEISNKVQKYTLHPMWYIRDPEKLSFSCPFFTKASAIKESGCIVFHWDESARHFCPCMLPGWPGEPMWVQVMCLLRTGAGAGTSNLSISWLFLSCRMDLAISKKYLIIVEQWISQQLNIASYSIQVQRIEHFHSLAYSDYLMNWLQSDHMNTFAVWHCSEKWPNASRESTFPAGTVYCYDICHLPYHRSRTFSFVISYCGSKSTWNLRGINCLSNSRCG